METRHPAAGMRAHGEVTGAGDAARGSLASVLLRPIQSQKTPACSAGCVTGADVRGWIGIVAQRRKLGLSDGEAYARAWNNIASVNPFPATLGRICPHPCERRCNRERKDGAVAINALERFLGDWGLRNDLRLPTLDEGHKPESIGVIGAGPAGLSFAYQMARRGYRVTVYEKQQKSGGMLHYGVPEYRLPEEVLEREVRRILDVGIDLEVGIAVGRDVSMHDLRERHAALFLGIGAARGLRLGIPGEEGTGAWTGVEYLGALNRGESVTLGGDVVVVGGGNTAMDAARSARRTGARVTVLYRRTSAEMPAIASAIEAALAEGVAIEYLASPIRIDRSDGVVKGVVAQRMRLGEAHRSGRRECIPLAGTEFSLPADSVIAAVSQAPDWRGLDGAERDAGDVSGNEPNLLGGDVLGPGVAGIAIAQGRRAAELLHAKLRGFSGPLQDRTGAASPVVKADFYASKERVTPLTRPVQARLADPDAEVEQTISEHQFASEAERCFSCGLCFGCEHCFMYCNPGAFTRFEPVWPGAYFALSLDRCEACG
jgi:NADPH-dependent glutamate synthase beta subunit-like oxidoreductase